MNAAWFTKYPYQAALGLAFVFVLILGLPSLLTAPPPPTFVPKFLPTLFALVIQQGGLFLAALLCLFIAPKTSTATPPSGAKLILQALRWTAALVPLACLTGILTEWLLTKLTTTEPVMQDALQWLQNPNTSNATRALICFAAVVAAPIAEEYFFRRMLFKLLRNRLSFWTATGISAIAFAAVHASLVAAPGLFIVGFVLAAAYERTQSVRLPILIHACFNSASLLLFFFAGAKA